MTESEKNVARLKVLAHFFEFVGADNLDIAKEKLNVLYQDYVKYGKEIFTDGRKED